MKKKIFENARALYPENRSMQEKVHLPGKSISLEARMLY
jgi:hypothetical protein